MRTISRMLIALGVVASLSVTAAPLRAAPAHARVTITIATVNNPQMIDMQHLTPVFEKQYGINVRFVTLPENTLRQKVTSDVATGGGAFDLATVGTYEVPIFAKNRWIINLQPYFNQMGAAARKAYGLSDVLPTVKEGLSYKGSLYALPFYGESSMTLYNKKILAAAHITMPMHPTWTQIRAMAAKLNNPAKNRYGIVLRGLPGWGEMGAPLTTVINGFGGRWFNQKWEPQLTAPATSKAINFYVDLLKKYGEPGASSSGFTECETAFAQGKGAIWVDATSASGLVTDPKTSKVAKDVGFAFAPHQVTQLGSHWLWAWALTMEASSKHRAEAFKFLTWATSKNYIKLVAGYKGWANVPPGTRLSTFQNPNYRRAVPYGNIILQSMRTANPNHATLLPVPYVGVQFVGIPEFQNIGTLVTQNLAGALTGRTSTQQALNTSQAQVTRIMTQAGYIH